MCTSGKKTNISGNDDASCTFGTERGLSLESDISVSIQSLCIGSMVVVLWWVFLRLVGCLGMSFLLREIGW